MDGGLGHGGHAEGRELESMSCLFTGLLIITRVLLLLLLLEEPQYVKINILLKEPAKTKKKKTNYKCFHRWLNDSVQCTAVSSLEGK